MHWFQQHMTFKGRIVLFLGAFFAVLLVQLNVNNYQSGVVLEQLDRQTGNFHSISQFSSGVERQLTALANFRWENGDAAALAQTLSDGSSACDAWLWRIDGELSDVGEEQYLLVQAVRTTYQGEELGMTNAHFTAIDQYRDVESLNYYRILQEQGHTAAEALEILAARSRDNGRTPMQWNAEPHAGFTTGTPWIGVVDNYKTINAAAQVEDEDSIFHWYQTLIALRKRYKVISEGRIEMLLPDDDALLAYRRWTDDEELLVVCNLTADTAPLPLPEGWQQAERLLGNYPAAALRALRPYECVALRRNAR